MRPRTHEVHVTTDDIDQLRQLIESKSPQPASYPGDAFEIVLTPFRRRAIDVTHGSKLDQLEGSHPLSETSLPEQHATSGIELDGQGDDSQNRREYHDQDQRRDEAQYPLRRLEDPRLPELLRGDELACRNALNGQLTAEVFVSVGNFLNNDSIQLEFEKLGRWHSSPPIGEGQNDSIGSDRSHNRVQFAECSQDKIRAVLHL